MPITRLRPHRLAAVALALAPFVPAQPSHAEEPASTAITIKDHRFEPSEIHMPTGKPAALVVTNTDDTAEKFDSSALKIEKVIVAGHKASIRLRPLGPGRFPFMGEFHPDTAQGTVVSE